MVNERPESDSFREFVSRIGIGAWIAVGLTVVVWATLLRPSSFRLFYRAPAKTPSGRYQQSVESRSYHVLTTGSGHGFQLYDVDKKKVIAFLDHPYRYVSAPADITQEGSERRNLLEELSFGISQSDKDHWLHDWVQGEAQYLQQTNVIRSQALKGNFLANTYYFSPYGLERNAMVALMHVRDQARASMKGKVTFTRAMRGALTMRFHLGDTPVSKDFWESTLEVRKIPGEQLVQFSGRYPGWAETGGGKGAMVYVPLNDDASVDCDTEDAKAPESKSSPWANGQVVCVGDDISLIFHSTLEKGWMGFLVDYVEDLEDVPAAIEALHEWLDSRDPGQVLKDSLDEWEEWRKKSDVSFRNVDEERLWRQSEAILRMSQVREPNRYEKGQLRTSHGMLLASLPPGNWATGWVRDGLYATAALARMGHHEEAKKSLDFFLNAEPVGKFRQYVSNSDYRISLTRYFGSGEEEADYSGESTPNIEMDGWGLYLWAARQYVESSGDVAWLSERTRKGKVYEAMLQGIVKPIEENLESPPNPRIMKADTSIWELHYENRKHFAYTTIAAARGLCDFAMLAKKLGRTDDYKKYRALAGEVRKAFFQTFGENDVLIGALERTPATDIDGAMTEAFTLDVIQDLDSELAENTLTNLEKLVLDSGGFKRNAGDHPYDMNEWVLVNFRMASLYLRKGQRRKAQVLLDRMTEKAALHFYLFPELYNSLPDNGPLGTYIGSIPMVGYGSALLTLALLEREGNFGPRECDW